MASNEYFDLSEKYKNNAWAAKIQADRQKDSEGSKDKSGIRRSTLDNSHNSDSSDSSSGCTKNAVKNCSCIENSPRTDSFLPLVMCWECKKFTNVHSLLFHIREQHKSIEEYFKNVNALDTLKQSYFEVPVNNSRRRKKVTPDHTSTQVNRSEDKRSEDNGLLSNISSQSILFSQVPVEGENSMKQSTNSYSKRKSESLKQRVKKTKAIPSYQPQEYLPNLTNCSQREQPTSIVQSKKPKTEISYQSQKCQQYLPDTVQRVPPIINPQNKKIRTESDNLQQYFQTFSSSSSKDRLTSNEQIRKGKSEASSQFQEILQNPSDSFLRKLPSSNVYRTESDYHSNHESQDSNLSFKSGHSDSSTPLTPHSSNNFASPTPLDLSVGHSGPSHSDPPSLSLLNATTSHSDEPSMANNSELNEILRTSSNESYRHISTKSSFPADSTQNTKNEEDDFLCFGHKPPVKPPPDRPPDTPSLPNSNTSQSNVTFLGVEKESSAPSKCSSPVPSVEDSFSKKSTVEEDKPVKAKSNYNVTVIRSQALHCTRPKNIVGRLHYRHPRSRLVSCRKPSTNLKQPQLLEDTEQVQMTAGITEPQSVQEKLESDVKLYASLIATHSSPKLSYSSSEPTLTSGIESSSNLTSKSSSELTAVSLRLFQNFMQTPPMPSKNTIFDRTFESCSRNKKLSYKYIAGESAFKLPSNCTSQGTPNLASQSPLNCAARAPPKCASHAPPKHTSHTPPKRASHAPPNRTSQSPPRHASQSSPKHASQSPPKHASQSSPKHASQSPPKHASQSPPKHASQSSPKHTSQSPINCASQSSLNCTSQSTPNCASPPKLSPNYVSESTLNCLSPPNSLSESPANSISQPSLNCTSQSTSNCPSLSTQNCSSQLLQNASQSSLNPASQPSPNYASESSPNYSSQSSANCTLTSPSCMTWSSPNCTSELSPNCTSELSPNCTSELSPNCASKSSPNSHKTTNYTSVSLENCGSHSDSTLDSVSDTSTSVLVYTYESCDTKGLGTTVDVNQCDILNTRYCDFNHSATKSMLRGLNHYPKYSNGHNNSVKTLILNKKNGGTMHERIISKNLLLNKTNVISSSNGFTDPIQIIQMRKSAGTKNRLDSIKSKNGIFVNSDTLSEHDINEILSNKTSHMCAENGDIRNEVNKSIEESSKKTEKLTEYFLNSLSKDFVHLDKRSTNHKTNREPSKAEFIINKGGNVTGGENNIGKT